MLSIVTVNLNNSDGLIKTLTSIKFNIEFQVIIIDGHSSDNSLKTIKEFKKKFRNYSFLHEKDKGVFDAMNKGLILAEFEWVVFMNSGDSFVNCNIIEKTLNDNKNIDILYGNHKMNNQNHKALELKILKKGIIHACHQSMFFNCKRLKNNLFYKNFRLYGDYELVNRLFLSGFKFKLIDEAFSDIEPDGISQKISTVKRLEKFKIVFLSYGFKGILNTYFN